MDTQTVVYSFKGIIPINKKSQLLCMDAIISWLYNTLYFFEKINVSYNICIFFL